MACPRLRHRVEKSHISHLTATGSYRIFTYFLSKRQQYITFFAVVQ